METVGHLGGLMETFFTNPDNIRCGIMGIGYESSHNLQEDADCVIRLLDHGDHYLVLKLTDIWCD